MIPRTHLTYALYLLAALGLAACTKPAAEAAEPAFNLPELTGATPWTDAALQDDADDFHFVVVSDRTCCARPGVFASAMPKVNLVSPAFVVSVGDLIEGYTENPAQLTREWNEIESYVGALDAPFFYTPGNHDMNNAVMAEEWQRRFGPSYYHFEYKDVLFVVLNSELFGMVGAPQTPVPGPWKQAEQMDFIRSVLSQNTDARWTIVLLHQPLWTARTINPDWLEIEGLLGERNYTVFAGHYHQYSREVRNNRNFITLATTGGGSGLRGTAYGEFDHVAWVTMRSDGPTIANLLLDGIQDVDVSNPELLGALNAISSAVTLETELGTTQDFTGAALTVEFVNPTDAPLTVSPELARKTNFEIAGLEPLTLGAGERRALDLRLTVDSPTPYAELVTAAVRWTVTGTIGPRPVQFPITKPVLPRTRLAIPPVGPVTVDGSLDEWGALRFKVARQGDILSADLAPEDASFAFDVREGEDQLYVAVDVTDDDVQLHEDLVPRAQDSIRLFIDPRSAAARNRKMGAGEALMGGDMAAQIGTIVATGATMDDELLSFVQTTNQAIEYRVVPGDHGYRAEFAIPLALIRERARAEDPALEDWTEARVSVGIYDLDTGEHVPTPLFWQPYPYGEASLPDTELFVRTTAP
ncbi:MAG: metallophosphoesterase [Pseudomonadota bacterium]